MDNKPLSTDSHYLFNVDILINARTNSLALQYLLELMNGSGVVGDFRINSELSLGKVIDSLTSSPQPAPKLGAVFQGKLSAYRATLQAKSSRTPPNPAQPAVSVNSPLSRQSVESYPDAAGQIRAFIGDNRLVRLRANRQGKQVSLPCRILNFDEEAGTITVYHVDEKQVYTFSLNEIDEFM